jgi:hypothetical protein
LLLLTRGAEQQREPAGEQHAVQILEHLLRYLRAKEITSIIVPSQISRLA